MRTTTAERAQHIPPVAMSSTGYAGITEPCSLTQPNVLLAPDQSRRLLPMPTESSDRIDHYALPCEYLLQSPAGEPHGIEDFDVLALFKQQHRQRGHDVEGSDHDENETQR